MLVLAEVEQELVGRRATSKVRTRKQQCPSLETADGPGSAREGVRFTCQGRLTVPE